MFRPITGHESSEEKYSSTLSLTSALGGGGGGGGSGWLTPRPGCSTPWKETRYPVYRRLGEPQGLSGSAENLASTDSDSRTFSVTNRYTDWAMPASQLIDVRAWPYTHANRELE